MNNMAKTPCPAMRVLPKCVADVIRKYTKGQKTTRDDFLKCRSYLCSLISARGFGKVSKVPKPGYIYLPWETMAEEALVKYRVEIKAAKKVSPQLELDFSKSTQEVL